MLSTTGRKLVFVGKYGSLLTSNQYSNDEELPHVQDELLPVRLSLSQVSHKLMCLGSPSCTAVSQLRIVYGDSGSQRLVRHWTL